MEKEALSRPPLPWKTRIQLALLSAITDASMRRDGTVNRRLMNFFDARVKPDPKPILGVRTADFSLNHDSSWVRVFTPNAEGSGDRNAALPILVFFHGGGFVFLSAASKPYDAVCRRFARKLNAVVVSVNYRLAPEHRYPAAYEDGLEALRWLDRDPTCSGFAPAADPARLFLAGDSAGGNLAHHVAVEFSKKCSEMPSIRLVGLVSIQPFFGREGWTDSEVRLKSAPIVSQWRTEFMWKSFLPLGLDRDHPAAHVWGPKSESLEMEKVAFPATMVVVGGMDPLQDLQRMYARWLKEKGKEVRLVEYESAIHAFYIWPELPEAPLLLAELKAFLQKQSKCDAGVKGDIFNPLSHYIALHYTKNGLSETLQTDLNTVRRLRSPAVGNPGSLKDRIDAIRSYLPALAAVRSRFPLSPQDENPTTALTFSWTDAFKPSKKAAGGVSLEMAAVVFNLGAFHSQARDINFASDGEVKLACNSFQLAAGAFAFLRHHESPKISAAGPATVDVTAECTAFLEKLMLAQAQECVFEKVIADGKPHTLCAKIAKQVGFYYDEANTLMNHEPLNHHFEKHSRVPHLRLKSSFFHAEASYRCSLNLHDKEEIGEEIARLKSAITSLSFSDLKKIGKSVTPQL